MPYSYEFRIKWYQRLRVKALAFFVVLAIAVIGVTTVTMDIMSEEITQRIAYEKLGHSQQQVMTGISERTNIAATLANAMASVAINTYQDPLLLKSTITPLINNEESKALVVGGGVWPEPFAFAPQKSRSSYFWSRNEHGELALYNDYNLPTGNGYHREEWYVPVQYLSPGQVYWSKPYVDPHSQQAMVTVAAPMIAQQKYMGTTTIDLTLNGLNTLLKNATERFNGYAFAIDRDGHLLSFPEESIARTPTPIKGQPVLAPFVTITDLARRHKEFRSLSTHIEQLHIQRPDSGDESVYSIGTKIAEESYQVGFKEALSIASSIVDVENHAIDNHQANHIFTIEKDYFFQQPAIAAATTMPSTGWHIVTVTPLSEATKSSRQLITALNLSIIAMMLIAIVLAGLLLKRIYADPLKALMNNLKGYIDKNDVDSFIEVKETSEFGELAHWFNQRTNELLASQEQVNSLAFYDPLTGLPNRKMLKMKIENKLSSAKKDGTCGALIYLDLDHFKIVNDSLGHDIGDQLLIDFKQRLKSCMRKGDMAGRLGGDEFFALLSLPNFKNHDKTKIPNTIANRILASLENPFILAGNAYHITASIGITFFDKNSQSFEEILKYADSAMYHSKSSGRGGSCFFEDGMQIKVDNRLRMEKDLRHAINSNGLSLAFQPQLTDENKCPSLEVLLRWIHPKEGYISPLDFISIAEESMLILPLGDWVIRKTCQQVKQWQEEGIIFDHISINISPIQFQQLGFVSSLSSMVQEAGIRPDNIMVELTEGVIIDNPERVAEKILQLKNMGFSVSIDDFGTGYSSLNYLKKLPLDELKIDRSFIQEITNDHADAVITETIINMAKNFGYTVIAEGVETEEQKELLIEKGCHYFQGFLFSKPIPPENIPAFVKNLEPSV